MTTCARTSRARPRRCDFCILGIGSHNYVHIYWSVPARAYPGPGHRRGDGVERAAPSTIKSRAGSGLIRACTHSAEKAEVASVFQLVISIQRRLGSALLLRHRAPGGQADRERCWGSAEGAGRPPVSTLRDASGSP